MVINSCLSVWNRLPRDWYCNQFVGHSLISDGARCLKVWGGIHKKDLPFTSAVRVSLAGNLGPSLPLEKNCIWD